MRTSTFYAAAMANLGIEAAAPLKRPVVTVVTKKGRRAIENAAEIAAALRARFIGVDVNLLDGNSLSAISVKARVRPLLWSTLLWLLCPLDQGDVLCCFPATVTRVLFAERQLSPQQRVRLPLGCVYSCCARALHSLKVLRG